MDDDRLSYIHRHFIWAHRFRRLYYEAGAGGAAPADLRRLDEAGAFLSFWYVNLFEIIELINSAGMVLDGIQDDLIDLYHGLRRFRNAVTHIAERQQWNANLFESLAEPATVRVVDGVHCYIGRYFFEDFDPDTMPSL